MLLDQLAFYGISSFKTKWSCDGSPLKLPFSASMQFTQFCCYHYHMLFELRLWVNIVISTQLLLFRNEKYIAVICFLQYMLQLSLCSLTGLDGICRYDLSRLEIEHLTPNIRYRYHGSSAYNELPTISTQHPAHKAVLSIPMG